MTEPAPHRASAFAILAIARAEIAGLNLSDRFLASHARHTLAAMLEADNTLEIAIVQCRTPRLSYCVLDRAGQITHHMHPSAACFMLPDEARALRDALPAEADAQVIPVILRQPR